MFHASFFASQPLLLLASFTYVHASPVHLYILQLFIHCSCIASSCLHPVSVCDVAIAFFVGVVELYWTIVFHLLCQQKIAPAVLLAYEVKQTLPSLWPRLGTGQN